MKYYVADIDKPTVVCEKHLLEKLPNSKAEFVGVGLSCFFCREKDKIHKNLWAVIQR